MALPQPIVVKADLDGDGTFETDWSAYLQGIDGPRLERDSAVDAFGPRKMTLFLDNEDSRFSPSLESGPYYPDLEKGRRVRVTAQIPVTATTNMLANPSLETNETSWLVTFDGTGSKSRTDGAGRFGAKGYQIIETAAGGWRAEQDSVGAPTVALDYTASVYVRAISDNAVGARMRVELHESGGAAGDAATLGPWVPMTKHHQRLEVTRNIAESDRTKLIIKVRRENAGHASNQTFAIDAAQVEQQSAATHYCDGDQPQCSWFSTAHASTSSRIASPTLNLFTGELREFFLERPELVATARYELTGLTETATRTQISAGPFVRIGGDLILRRLMDVLDERVASSMGFDTDIVPDGAMKIGQDAWVALNGTTVTKEYDVGAAGDDPIVYDAVEGDQVLRVTNVDATDEGAALDVDSLTDGVKFYKVACFVKGVGGSVGKAVKVTGTDFGGSVTLTAGWQYLSTVLPAKFTGTPRKMQIVSTGAGWASGGPYEFQIDCATIVQVEGLFNARIIDYAFLGTKLTDDLEYIDAYRRSARATLDEAASSLGAWVYEDGSGAIVFESYDRRDPTVVTVPTMRLSDALGGGFPYEVLSPYSEPMASQASTVKVGSYGNIVAIPAANEIMAKQAWRFDGPVTLGVNEVRVFHADHVTGGGVDEPEGGASGLIARRPVGAAVPQGGWVTLDGVQTPFNYVKSYGRSSDITIKAPAGGKTLLRLVLACRVQQREQTERVFVEAGSDEPIMELNMPAQGYQTAAMSDLATWALAKYSTGPAVLEVEIVGDTTEDLLNIFDTEIGRPVYLEHQNGPGAFGIGGMFFVEGIRIIYRRPGAPRLRLRLEEA